MKYADDWLEKWDGGRVNGLDGSDDNESADQFRTKRKVAKQGFMITEVIKTANSHKISCFLEYFRLMDNPISTSCLNYEDV